MQKCSGSTTTDDETDDLSQAAGDLAEQGPPLLFTLSVAYHPQPGKIGLSKPIPAGASWVLGRDASVAGATILDNAKISRRHARLTAQHDTLILEDLGSRNGTTVNGVACKTSTLSVGDVIGVGPILLVVHKAPGEYTIPRHPRFIGKSYVLATVLESIDKVAPFPSSVLLYGESGTGKELAAREIHLASGRPGRMCAVNCGMLTGNLLQSEIFGHARGAFTGAERDRTGLVESAHQGTLFLDEIAEAPMDLQVSLLRLLEDGEIRALGKDTSRKIDARIIAASHQDLGARTKHGNFRDDLYARLSGWKIRLPPLRERVEDIPHLAAHFVQKLVGKPLQISMPLMRALLLYSWPHNIRELKTVVDNSVIEARGENPVPLCPSIAKQLAPLSGSGQRISAAQRVPGPMKQKAQEIKNHRKGKPSVEDLTTLVKLEQGNVRRVAATLGVSRYTLYRWLDACRIDPTDYRGSTK